MLYGEHERILHSRAITINGKKLTVYCHDNGITAVPNTKSNISFLSQIEKEEIEKTYDILDKKEAPERMEDTKGVYYQAVLVMKKRRKAK